MAKSYYLDNAVLQAVLAAVQYTSPSAVYVALYTSAPGPTGGGTEVSGGSYQRTACTFGAPTNGALTNSGACTFPQASAVGAPSRPSASSTRKPTATCSTTAT